MEFQIINIEHSQFEFFEENYIAGNSEISSESDVSFNVDIEQKVLITILSFNISSDEKLFLKSKIIISFAFEHPFWKDLKKGKTVVISKKLMAKVIDIAINTIRGLLFEKLSDTKISTYIFPIIELSDMIKKDVVFEI